ncbi:MAG: tetratricopeptide repeat protein [Treponema sp.]|jgi:TolA-binding protein|nr:tetratricopeptide repeat protein [Treponema sp.]
MKKRCLLWLMLGFFVFETPPVWSQPFPDLEPKEAISYSRIVQAAVGQQVEIPFRGSGWVYLGEMNSQRGIDYDSRRLDNEGQSFIFQAGGAGTYGLKFYKQDFLRDYIVNDYVQVIVSDAAEPSGNGLFKAPVDRGRVIAEPRWPALPEDPSTPSSAPPVTLPAAPVAAAPQGTAPAAIAPQRVTPPAESPPPADGPPQAAPPAAIPAAVPPEIAPQPAPVNTPLLDYLQQAREAQEAGKFPEALSLLEQFREQYPLGSDEAWWLYGQVFEANSQVRDIRSALDYYRRLIRDYPQSPRCTDAKRRIAYLERYYFNIL